MPDERWSSENAAWRFDATPPTVPVRTCHMCGVTFEAHARIIQISTIMCAPCYAHYRSIPEWRRPIIRACVCGRTFNANRDDQYACETCLSTKARRDEEPVRRRVKKRKPAKKPKAPATDKRPTAWDRILDPVLQS